MSTASEISVDNRNRDVETPNENLTELHVDVPKMSMVVKAIIKENGSEYSARGETKIGNSTSCSSPVKVFNVDTLKNSSFYMVLHGKVEAKGIADSESKNKKGKMERDNETRARHLKLYRAALRDDWKTAKAIYDVHKNDVAAKISRKGYGALHIAAAVGSSKFAMNLIKKMETKDLEIKDNSDNTAFCFAAASGNVELAEAMMRKNENLTTVKGSGKKLPLFWAAAFGQNEMVKLLKEVTPDNQPTSEQEQDPKQVQKHEHEQDQGPKQVQKQEQDRVEFFFALIRNELYEIALDLLKKHPELALARGGGNEGETALHVLAKKPISNQQGIWERLPHALINLWERCCNLFPCIQCKCRYKKQPSAHELLVRRLWKQVISELDSDSGFKKFIKEPEPLLSVAAEQGNLEFLRILIRKYPDVMFTRDEEGYNIFHIAVKNRQNDIFKWIHEIGSFKDFTVVPKNTKQGKNNLLHLVGMLAAEDRLNTVSGAALQMQRELLWFQAVEKIVFKSDAETKNDKELTPRALFTKEHKELKKKGEEWMRDTANSCLIVATLITTVVFAAAFTVPGGTNETTGSANLLHEASLTIFLIADAISLISSSCSILIFLSILTYRYNEDAFSYVLPRKLLFGVATLLISIVSMMTVFCATYFIISKEAGLTRAVVVTGMASVPVLLYLYHQIPLLIDLVRSTYFSSSLFNPRKRTLFNKKLKAKESKKADCLCVVKTRIEI